MAFPNNPTTGQIYRAANGKRFKFQASGGWVEIYPVLTGSITYAVPGDFATLNAAMDYLRAFTLAADCSILINVTSHALTGTVRGHNQGSQISIVGANSPAFVQADFVCTGNTAAARLTDNAANLTMLQSKFTTQLTGGFGLSSLYGETLTVSGLLLIGGGFEARYGGYLRAVSCASSGGPVGFYAESNAALVITSCVTINATVHGFASSFTSSVSASGTSFSFGSNGGSGFAVSDNSSMTLQEGVTGGNSYAGINLYRNASFRTSLAITSLRDSQGIVATNTSSLYLEGSCSITNVTAAAITVTRSSSLHIAGATSLVGNGATIGITCTDMSLVYLAALTTSGFSSSNITASMGSTVNMTVAASLGSGPSISMTANSGAFIYSVGATGTVTRSPTVNTVNNSNAFIQG